MPQAGLAIASWWGGLSAWAQGVIITAAVSAVSYGVNQLLAEDIAMPEVDTALGTLVNQRSTQATIPLLYGRTRVGINQAYIKTIGSDNRYMHMIALIGEGPIAGLVRQDGSRYETTGANIPTSNPPQIYFDDKLWTHYAGYAQIQFFNGAHDQALCSALAAVDPGFAQLMRYTSHLYIRLTYSQEKFNVSPKVTVVADGLLITNPVTGITEWTDNAALCTYDFMTRPSTRGGMGLPAAAFPVSVTSDAIDYCTALNLTASFAITENQYAGDNLARLLACWRGKVPPSADGTISLLFRDLNYESTVMALTESDVVEGSLKVSQPDISSRPNAIRIKYYSKADNYQLADYVHTDVEALAIDGDYRELEIEVPGLNTLEQIQPMAVYLLERARNRKTAEFVGGRRTLALLPEDLTTFTHSLPGWSEKPMRVIAADPDLENWQCRLTLLEESTAFYDGDYDAVIEDLFETSLPDPSGAVPNVTGVSGSEVVYPYRGRSFTRWIIDFSKPPVETYPWWDYAEVWMKIGSAGEWRYMTRSEGNYVVDPVQEGEYYAIKLVSVNIFGNKETFDSAIWIDRTIIGKTDLPTDLSAMTAVANGDSVSIYADPVDDPDIDGYEVRLGDAWEGGIFISFNKAPSLRLNGVRPGSHTFWMSPARLGVDGTRIYSGTPVSATCRVFVPTGFTLADSWTWDFEAIGTHDNTEHVTHNSQDALKCSHTGDVLTGDWTSPQRDLGSIQIVRLWGETATDFRASDTIFDGVGGQTLSFDELGGQTKSFFEIFEPTIAGQLQITLQYSTDGSSWNDVERFEILCAEVEARYIRVVVTIIDPTLDSNLYLYALPIKAYTGPQ